MSPHNISSRHRRSSRPIALFILGTDGGGWSVPRHGSLQPRKSSSTHGTGGWLGQGPVWKGVENGKFLSSTRFRIPKRPVHSESLCQTYYAASKEAKPCGNL